jgi:hypothetical protein
MIGFIGLFDSARDYTLYFAITHTLVPTVTSSLPLLCSGFQRRTFLFLWVPELSTASATSFKQQQLTTTERQRSSNWLTHHITNWIRLSQCQSKSYFTTGGLQPISSSWRQTPWDSRYSNFIFQLNLCGYNPYVTSSLTRGWVCRLKLLLVLASVVILRSESRGTNDHILLSQIRVFLNLDN